MERVSVSHFLEDLDRILGNENIPVENPIEYDLCMALRHQIHAYTMCRMRSALKGQDWVHLPDAKTETGVVFNRRDWDWIQ